MSRDNIKKYPRTIESKTSYLRIRAPEHLDVALEGLIRKVLKEQPKMDDLYAFAADYFDMLLKIREKSGIRKISVQDICPQHNEEDANEIIKVASAFTKRKKEPKLTSQTYRVVSLNNLNPRPERKALKSKDGEVKNPNNGERFNSVLPIVKEHPELEDTKPMETVFKSEKAEPDSEENDMECATQSNSQDLSEKIIEAREIILEEETEEEDGNTVESDTDTGSDVKIIRDKIKEVEYEIKSLVKKESKISNAGNSEGGTLGEVKVEDEDVKTAEGTTIIEKPLQELEDSIPSAESKVTIEEVTADDDKKEIDEEKVTMESAQEAGTASNIEEIQETEAKTEITSQEAEGEIQNVETRTEETQKSKADIVAEQTREARMPGEETLEENRNDQVVLHFTGTQLQESQYKEQESGVQRMEEAEETADESLHTIPNADDKTEEAETKSESEVTVEEPPAIVAKLEDTIEDRKETEEANPNTEDAIPKLRSADQIQVKETELTGGEEPENENLETEEFIGLEKQPYSIQNAEAIGKPSEGSPTSEPPTDGIQRVIEDDTIVIMVPENVEEKIVEEDSTLIISEGNCSGKGEIVKPVLQEAIAVAGGFGATAAVLEHAKRELTDENPEESIIKEEKTGEAEPQKAQMTLTEEVEKFLGWERKHSSYETEIEVLKAEELGNPETETSDVVVIETGMVSVPGSLARNTQPGSGVKDEEIHEKGQSGPSYVELEGDDQEQDASTTSDEIEFETSSLKYPETTVDSNKRTDETDTHVEKKNVNVTADEGSDSDEKSGQDDKMDAKLEPSIVLELNKGESEEQKPTGAIEEPALGQVTTFLAVPEPVVEEYPGRKAEDAMQQEPTQLEGQSRLKGSVEPSAGETGKTKEEAKINSDFGNEIIQTGEVQKVELIEGDEDILQVHLTTTIETVQENTDSVLVQMTSKIDPMFEVSMETKVESPVLDEKMRLVRAAVIIQNGYRRFKKRSVRGEPMDISNEELDISTVSETVLDLSMQTVLKDPSSRESDSSFSSLGTKNNNRDFRGRKLNRSATRTLLETHSFESIRKISPLKTRSLSTVRYGVADFEVWNQLITELEEAATKIQSNYRGYKTRKKLERGIAVQSTTTPSDDSSTTADSAELNHRHTGELHDSLVLPLPQNNTT